MFVSCSNVVISSFPLVNSVEVEEHCVMSEWLRLVMTCGTADRIMSVSKPQFVQGYERNSILKTKLSALIPADACWQICNCPIVHLEPGLCKDCGGGSDSCHQGPGPGKAGTRVIGCNQQPGCTQLYLSIKARHVVMVVTDVFTLVS